MNDQHACISMDAPPSLDDVRSMLEQITNPFTLSDAVPKLWSLGRAVLVLHCEAARQALADQLSRIETINWEVDYEHDGEGRTYPYVQEISLTRDDGVTITMGNPYDDDIISVLSASAPKAEGPVDLHLAGLIALSNLDRATEAECTRYMHETEDEEEACERHLGGFCGAKDPKKTRDVIGRVFDLAYAASVDLELDAFKLR